MENPGTCSIAFKTGEAEEEYVPDVYMWGVWACVVSVVCVCGVYEFVECVGVCVCVLTASFSFLWNRKDSEHNCSP